MTLPACALKRSYLLIEERCKSSFCTVRVVCGEHPRYAALQCIACRFDNADIAVARPQGEVADRPKHVSVHSIKMSNENCVTLL